MLVSIFLIYSHLKLDTSRCPQLVQYKTLISWESIDIWPLNLLISTLTWFSLIPSLLFHICSWVASSTKPVKLQIFDIAQSTAHNGSKSSLITFGGRETVSYFYHHASLHFPFKNIFRHFHKENFPVCCKKGMLMLGQRIIPFSHFLICGKVAHSQLSHVYFAFVLELHHRHNTWNQLSWWEIVTNR